MHDATLHLIDVAPKLTVDPAYIEQLRQLNVAEQEIENYITQQNKLLSFDVLPENWDAVQLFQQSLTQRIRAGMNGVVTGFDYSGVAVVMQAYGYGWDVFKQFQQMEILAINYWQNQ